MAGPKLNDGKVYIVTFSAQHLGDYRTFAEALACARAAGAIGGADREYDERGELNKTTYDTPSGGRIFISVEFVDPLYEGKS